MDFAGIPVQYSRYLPENEIWLVKKGKAEYVLAPSGEVLRREIETPTCVVRVVNLGDDPIFTPKTFDFRRGSTAYLEQRSNK